jgi:S-(hydroxymethyl)glutathione dehydrogenase/alcohol dehydrogenase
VIPLYTPECRQCKFCLSRKTNLCQAIRATQGQGLMPDGTSRFSLGGKPLLHYMGTSTFANTSCARDRAGQDPRGRALRQGLLHRLRRDHRHRRGDQHRQGEPGANVVVFGLGGIGLNVIQGARMVGADMIIGVDLNPAREAMARSSA